MSVKIVNKGHLEYCYLKIRLDFEEPANPEIDVVQFKCAIIQAVKSLFGITGASNQIDILKYTEKDRSAIVRVHHRFLAQFWSSLTLYSVHDGVSCAFRVLQVSAHLMALAANSRSTPIRTVAESVPE